MMVGKYWRAGGRISILAQALACTVMPFEAAWSMPAELPPPMYVGSIDPDVLWEMLIGGTVVCSFLAAIVLWLHSLLRQAKRARLRRDAFISAALNNLNQGVMITDRRNRVVFCNDRFLDIYGLSRADVTSRMTGRDLIEMRRKRGLLSTTVEEYATLARRPEGLVTELPGGRSV